MIDKYLSNASITWKGIIKSSSSVLGLPVKIYYPSPSGIFGEDSNFTYNSVADWEGRAIVTGLFEYLHNVQGASAELLGEAYLLSDVNLYLDSDVPIPPENSKVVITVNDVSYQFVVDSIKEDVTKYNGFYILNLRPMR